MHIACWIPESTNTHSEHVLLLFHCNSGCINMPECCVARAVPVLLFIDYEQEKIQTLNQVCHTSLSSTHC